MTNIPKDIMEKAREVRQACVWNSNASVETVARALLAERERCAKIIEDEGARWKSSIVEAACAVAASNIRGGSNDRG